MKNAKEKKTAVVTVRFTASVKEELARRAKEGFRTISQEAEMLILKALKKGLK